MSTGIVVYVALLIALAAAAGWASEALARQFGRPARWAWLAASVLGVVLILRASIALPGERTAGTLSRIALPAASTVAAAEWTPLQVLRDAIAQSAATVGSTLAAVVRHVPHRATVIFTASWLVTSLLALVVLALVHLRIRRARRGWAEAELLGTRVRIAPDVGPAVVGMLRPQIVVPRWLLARSVDEQQLVLDHEREHLGARDHLLLGAGSLLVALVPWHPAAWWILARLRLAIELDCDARVLRKGVPARTYGTLLIDLADRCTGFRVGATALADEGSHLERRLLAMKTNSTKRSMLRAGVFGTAAALALLAACEAKVPTGPEIQAMDVASAERAATSAQMLRKTQLDSALYYVDGKAVDGKTANALTPDEIATISITKGAGARSEIVITTKAAAKAGSGERLSLGDPLVFIDGVKANQAQLKALDPKQIVTINVIKGAAAEAMSSDPAAKNGIIKVITKQ